MTDFVHLHVHSDFSLGDAAVSVMALADKAERLGMKHLALTDHGNMFGVMEFVAACKETPEDYIDEKGETKKRTRKRNSPITPIVGCEVYVSPGSRFEKKEVENENWYYHLVLLVTSREGYLNLIKLCSFAYTEGFYRRPRIDEELLQKYHGGLIALSACVSGEIPRLIRAGKAGEALEKARHYQNLFGTDGAGNPNFYLEIQDHGIPAERLGGTLSQKDINLAIVDIARRTGIPLVATNDVHYLDREDYVAHDILLCIGTGKVRTEEKRKKYYGDQFYLKTGDEMAALFSDYPEALLNTVRIAERCAAEIPKVETGDLPKYLPEFDIPPAFKNADEYLEHLALDGLEKRYASEKQTGGKSWEEILDRAKYELNTIIKMGYTGYFLIVADFINWARAQAIPVGPGRGSGAGSIVAYSLRITDVDPLKYKLLFERFLNPERISMPDFDVDFANDGREEVIKYVTEKYGRERVGQIITFGTLAARAVIKDVARTLGITIPESEMITKLIPTRDPKEPTSPVTLSKAFQWEGRLRELEQDSRYTELFTLARKLEGLNRHSSIHPAGIVIGKSELHNFVPLFRDTKTGSIATQYSMNFLETSGLVKMDFLGLKTLDVIKRTVELIRLRGSQYAGFSMEKISETDKATFKMLGEGKSFEVFQFESDGMQDVLKRAKPGSIEDLIALNSLYRPGPMDNINQFIESKNGRQKIKYPDPSLEDTLKETYGVIVYQEQVMQVARIVAGFSLGHADELRRAMGKKNMEKMVKEKMKFIAGAVERGYSEKKADEIFELLIPFAGYGFNKSHAAAYSVVAYQTAYLKANFPAEFMAANLTNEINAADKDKLSKCIAETRKMEIAIDPPDINRSDKLFTVVGGRIVYGLLGIKGLGDGPADTIVKERQENGPYRDFMDFLRRIDIKAVGKSVIERLIQTGAFDRLKVKRETLLGNLGRVVEYVQSIKDDEKYGQISLFGNTGEKEHTDFEFEDFPEAGRADKLKIEKELIGFYFSGHPMDDYRKIWQQLVKVNLGQKETLAPGMGSHILVGLLKNLKVFPSGGGKMGFGVLEDYNGEIDLTFFKAVWEKYQNKISADKVAILKGKIDYQSNKDKHSFIVDEYLEAEDAERIAREEEAQERKWEKYRVIWKYAKDLDLRLLDLSNPTGAGSGTFTAIGAVTSIRTHEYKEGKEMAFGTLQNYQGEINLLLFDRAWANCKALIALDEIIALKGTIDPAKDKNPAKPSFTVTSVLNINKLVKAAAKKAAEEPAVLPPNSSNGGVTGNSISGREAEPAEAKPQYREIHIRLKAGVANNTTILYSIRNCLIENPGPYPVFIHLPSNKGETIIRIAGQINAAIPAAIDALTQYADAAEAWPV